MYKNFKKKKSKFKRRFKFVIFLFIIISVAIMLYIPHSIMRSVIDKKIKSQMYTSEEFGIKSKEIILNTDDGLRIQSWLVREANAKGTIIILSGVEKPSVTAFFGYARMFADRGYNSLLIEMRAHNNSDGEEVKLGMKEWLDVKAGVDYLMRRERTKELPVIVMGTSMGGATAIVSAAEINNIDAVISISSYSNFSDVFEDALLKLGLPKIVAKLENYFSKLYLGVHYGFGNLKYSPKKSIKKLGPKKLLLMHSIEDNQVSIANYERLIKEIKRNNVEVKSFIRDGTGHFVVQEEFFNEPEKDIEFSKVIFDFLENLD